MAESTKLHNPPQTQSQHIPVVPHQDHEDDHGQSLARTELLRVFFIAIAATTFWFSHHFQLSPWAEPKRHNVIHKLTVDESCPDLAEEIAVAPFRGQ